MPYTWSKHPPCDPPVHLELTAHKSLPPTGFVLFFAITALLMAIPVIGLLGTIYLWVILGYLALTFGAVWLALRHSWRRADVRENIQITSDNITLTHHRPGKPAMVWEENPYWTKPELHHDSGPVVNYITLSGRGRTVELGSFLSQDERKMLFVELKEVLRGLNPADL